MKTLTKVLAGAALSLTASVANAGNIFMTGHDVLLHSGQNGYDNVILDYLRNGDVPAADYDIGLFRNTQRSGLGTLGVNTLEGFGTRTDFTVVNADTAAVVDAAYRANFVAFLAGIDVLVIPSHQSCGGCNLLDGHADILEALSGEITDFFNAGGDLYVNSGANDSTFYDFLPASVATTGPPISGSSGFTCTADGVAIGIDCGAFGSNINGFATHNRFTGFDSDFTIFETRGTDEFISIGLLDGVIGTDDITTDDSTDGTTDIPAPGTLFLFSSVLLGLGALRRKKA